MKTKRVLLTSVLPTCIAVIGCGDSERDFASALSPATGTMSAMASSSGALSMASGTATGMSPSAGASTTSQSSAQPSSQSSALPSSQASSQPSNQSSAPPSTSEASAQPSSEASSQASSEASSQPSSDASAQTSSAPDPSTSPSMDPSGPTGATKWGEEEDPSSGCTVSDQLPGYSELTPEGTLPDPFIMLDGTRITAKSQWACRRAELLKQLFNYVYGDKPIPPPGSVTGTVSATKISVTVTEGSKTTSFDVDVAMNGATAPAPAIICYDGGLGCALPTPNGVAKITFKAVEGQGGSGNKTGPFYTYYGGNHPAGYMVAQAWQVSRILDLLEQNPGVIDPAHVGVTGCSRNGKGAFAGGVFDNRIALTIPCESGIGGTVGLRLKEQLDPGANDTAEWPYHAISYVRWLSEVALGPFATGNDANGDNTDKLPVDMHDAMALIAPRALYIVDNPGITNLDPKSAYVTGMAGKAVFEALGVGDHFAYQGAGGTHCQWRSQYDASLNAMVDRFLKGNDSAQTGNFATDLGNKPNAAQYYTWDATELSGDL